MTVGDGASTGARISPASSVQRATALGSELVEVHRWLRQWLHQLRSELDSPDGPAPAGLRSLRAHCTGFCSALTRHHTSEDQTAFPLLAAPEAKPPLAGLWAPGARQNIAIDVTARFR